MHKQLTFKERQFIEKYWRMRWSNWSIRWSKSRIARELGVSHTTVGREVNNPKNWDWTLIWVETSQLKKAVKIYNAKKAHANFTYNKSRCGAKYKFHKDKTWLDFIEHCVLCGESPAAAIKRTKVENIKFEVDITDRTFYNYVEHGISKITPFDLRFKLRRRLPKHKIIREHKRKMGKSIELRPENINNRTEFGHWEGDCIVDKNDNAILVVQERKSRFCQLRKLAKHESKEVLEKVNQIQKEVVMKSLTVDNGSEFYKITQLENEIFDVYFTRPYSSFEKGGIENLNGIIRRYIPKGTDLSTLTDKDVERVQKQVNSYPRGIHGYLTAEEIFISLTENKPPVIIPRTNNVVFLNKKMCN